MKVRCKECRELILCESGIGKCGVAERILNDPYYNKVEASDTLKNGFGVLVGKIDLILNDELECKCYHTKRDGDPCGYTCSSHVQELSEIDNWKTRAEEDAELTKRIQQNKRDNEEHWKECHQLEHAIEQGTFSAGVLIIILIFAGLIVTALCK